MSRSDFVRKYPKKRPADLIRFAKRHGVELTNSLIATVRAKDRDLGPPPRTGHGAASSFVRAHPRLKADEVVALAARKNILVTIQHVYVLRSRDRAASKKRKKRRASGR